MKTRPFCVPFVPVYCGAVPVATIREGQYSGSAFRVTGGRCSASEHMIKEGASTEAPGCRCTDRLDLAIGDIVSIAPDRLGLADGRGGARCARSIAPDRTPKTEKP